jgi:hypothetical protein
MIRFGALECGRYKPELILHILGKVKDALP